MDAVTLALSKKYTDKKIAESGIQGFQVIIVSELPTTGLANTLYLLPHDAGSPPDYYDEYIYIQSAWERLNRKHGRSRLPTERLCRKRF